MDYNSTHTQVSPRKTDLIRKSQVMSTTIAELSKATLELKKIESKIQNKTPASTLTYMKRRLGSEDSVAFVSTQVFPLFIIINYHYHYHAHHLSLLS